MAEVLQYDANAVQGVVNYIWYAIIGALALALVVYLLYKLWQELSYNYLVDVYKKVGNATVQLEDKAKQVQLEGSYMFHYKNLKKYSPVIEAKYFRLKQKSIFFGLFKKTFLAFGINLVDDFSIFPVAYSDNPGLVPINIDQFNYSQARLKAIQEKYKKTSVFMQVLPYLALGGVILMFIVGMIFYTKHIEVISMNILNSATSTANTIAQSSGAIQIIPGT